MENLGGRVLSTTGSFFNTGSVPEHTHQNPQKRGTYPGQKYGNWFMVNCLNHSYWLSSYELKDPFSRLTHKERLCSWTMHWTNVYCVPQRGGTCLESEYPYEGVQGICRYENNPLWNPKQHILPISQTGKVEKVMYFWYDPSFLSTNRLSSS